MDWRKWNPKKLKPWSTTRWQQWASKVIFRWCKTLRHFDISDITVKLKKLHHSIHISNIIVSSNRFGRLNQSESLFPVLIIVYFNLDFRINFFHNQKTLKQEKNIISKLDNYSFEGSLDWFIKLFCGKKRSIFNKRTTNFSVSKRAK